MTVKLPCSTSRRGATTYVRAVSFVYPRWRAVPFEGKTYRAGARVPLQELPMCNEQVLAVECAGSEKPGWGHRREPSTYILWRLPPGMDTWTEIARASSIGAEWTQVLHAAAIALFDRRERDLRAAEDAAHRVIVVLEYELDRLGQDAERADLCARLQDRVIYQLLKSTENGENSYNNSRNLLYIEGNRPI